MASKGRERSNIASAATELLVIRVAGNEVVIDASTLTMRERQTMKAALGKLDEPDDLDATVASIWIVMRRDDPTLTFEEVCDSITLADIGAATTVPRDERNEADPS